jgi:hypothetical protein
MQCSFALIAAVVLAHQSAAQAQNVAPRETAAVSQTQVLSIRNVTVRLDIPDASFRVGKAELTAWVERSAQIVADYYGRFPADKLQIRVLMSEGNGVQGGTTWGSPEARIRTRVGREATADELRADWVMVHEMVHLALPEVGRRHPWLAEGVATYVEGIARVQAGNREAAAVWAELLNSVPQGLPKAGDAGLDNTHTWGRTYWGGALFCLLADVEIRRRTDNKFGLQHALRAVMRSSGGLGTDWGIERVFATGDEATGAKVLQELYAQMKDTPVTPDLAAFWQSLGIERDGRSVTFRDDAPLAATREAIMRPSQPRE